MFTALQYSAKDFSSGFVNLKRAPVKTIAVLLGIGLVFVHSLPAQSAPDNALASIGITETTKIYPSVIKQTEWDGYEYVLSPDVAENALYQDFSKDTAAYVTDKKVNMQVVREPEPVQPEAEVEELEPVLTEQETTASTTESEPEVIPESEEQTEEPVQEEGVVEPVVEAEPEVIEMEPEETGPVVLKKATESVFAFFNTVTQMLPFAQLSSTTPNETEEVPVEEAIPEVEPAIVVEEVATTTPEEATEEEEVFEEVQPEPEQVIEVQASTTEEVVTEEQAEEVVPVESAESAVETVEKTISLADFSMLPLEPGTFVKNIQLRASFAGLYEGVASGTVPVVEFTLQSASGSQPLGAILLDGEASNAINGGYYLFGFPQYEDVSVLTDLAIDVTYKGPLEGLDGAFLDALWLEVETETITKEDLYKRTEGLALGHLKSPEAHDFVSSKKDFMRGETPVFNLRYVSQRNRAVEAVREFLGVRKIKVQQVKVLHKGGGEIGIEPEVTVTKDGLVSISIPEDQQAKMKPGQYTIELFLEEGGASVSDSFDFQWGILAINTNKTEYTYGETAEVSMGALTLNGNTLCNADLRLYVVNPRGGITTTPVVQSGECKGNNVVDVPDYTSSVLLDDAGSYELYLERIGNNGEVIGHTGMNFEVVLNQPLTIERVGPTRIFPPAPYPMQITVTAEKGFSGTLVERVPNTFAVSAAGADINDVNGELELTWDINLLAGQQKTVSYTFDAPDLSPYLYELGPAELVAAKGGNRNQNGSSTASSTPSRSTNQGFVEHRQWQIASDATGNMILFWDDGASIPTDWSCLSCGSGTFFQNFAIGTTSTSYGSTSGSVNHTHTASGSVLGSASASTEAGSGTIAPVAHTHTYSPTISTVSNLPSYRQLRVIQYTASAGEPATLPTGAIAVFDATVPTGWTRYSAQDGYYIYGEDTPGVTGGSNTDSHAITGTTGASTGTGQRVRGGGAQASGASDTHTHDISSASAGISKEPPYIEVILGKLDTAAAPTNGIISMWTDEVPSGWLDVSSDEAAPFNNRLIKGSATYGTTGGSLTHTPADVTGITSGAPSATISGRVGTAGSGGSHTHSVSVTGFSTENHLPPVVGVVFGKRQGTDPVYEQLSYRWYVNENAQTPTDPWPVGASNLLEGEVISATSTKVKVGDEVRLRISSEVSNATSTAGSGFKLQYAAGDVCSAIGTWFTVGDTASSTAWRGYDNSSVTDNSTLASTTLASTTVAETYQENGLATSTPTQIPVGDVGEWDFVLQHNGASAGTNYCFRMVEEDGTPFSTYTVYPQIYTNEAPVAPTLSMLFDNEKASTTNPVFTFVTTDPEGEALHYQVQIDDDFAFGSTLEDRNTISNAAQFENLVDQADKSPFTSGHLMQFDPASTLSNGTTYWWRVRAQDPDGSDEWGEWSTPWSFTIDTTLTASAWFQTTQEQFDTNTLVGVKSLGSDAVDLATGSTTGTMTSGAIDFDDGVAGTAWDSLVFSDTETTGDVKYSLQYLNDAAVWTDIPDADLPGNSTGFDASPVSLLDIDTDTYNELRIVATLTDAGGSPSIQDWGINWGYRVETPTISTLFSNEKTGTTTPSFTFTTTDPQSDDLTYQISWSTDETFAASTTRTSSDPGTFVNLDAGADTSPFNSGDLIQYTVESGDALTNNTTYWWRVRAKDPAGDDAWSFWTEPRSFTVDTTVVVSTWFQTTQEQFDTNILSGTIALGGDSVAVATTASEALVVYGEGTATEPRYRQWDGSSWGAEGSLGDVGAPLVWARVEAGTTREEYVAVTVGTDADVNAQVFANGEWGDLQEMTTNVGNTSARGIALTYETLSGDAMVVYCNNTAQPSFYTWDGSTWTSEGTITVSETTNCEWLELASDPVSNEIIMVLRGADGSPYEAQVWNGSAWGNTTTLGNITESAHAGMAVAYEESGNQAVVVASNGNPARYVYSTWNGTTWSASANQTIGDDFEWGSLVADVGSDELALCYQDEDTNIGMVRWDGAAWVGQIELLSTVGKAKADPGFSCVFETEGSRDNYIMTAYTDTTQTNYSFWNNTSWSTGAQIDTLGDSITSQLERTGVGLILGLFFDETNDSLQFSSWDGTSWATISALEDDMSVDTTPYGHPYHLAVRNSGKEGTTIVSPGINFTDGVGPYWQSFSWNDTTPGTSEILYSMQYYDGDSWEFIPSSDLPFNEIGTSTSPYDLSSLNKNTYSTLRPYAALSCDGSDNCPELLDWTVTWAEGITISGTARQYDQSTNVTSGTVAVAVNGVLQTGKTGSISGGTWSIPNVTVFPGDTVTVFISGAADANEAVGVTTYDGIGDVTGFDLYERHIALGSNDATTTALTNEAIGLYDFTNTEDIFFDVTGTTLDGCATTGCSDVEVIVNASTTYNPQGTLLTHDIEINGTLLATSTLYVSGSWDNNATTTLSGSSVVMTATSTVESIDTSGAVVPSFGSLTFGTTTGSATWGASSTIDVNGDLTVERGTFLRDGEEITVAGDLHTAANGFWSGAGTTTFDGTTAATWSDANATLQNVGTVVIDGNGKVVTLASDVLAESITIAGDDTLDASVSSYDLTTNGNFINNNSFVARNGAINFAAVTPGYVVTAGGDAFYDMNFTGIGGSWSFTESELTVDNNFSIATGTVTMPTAATSIAGSFSSAGGTFAHNNSVIDFTGGGAESITASGTAFTNTFYDLTFSGTGSWTMLDSVATSSNDVRVEGGTLVLPSGELAVGGSFTVTDGSLTAGTGILNMFTVASDNLTLGTAQLGSLLVSGGGSVTMTDTNATLTGDVTVSSGTLVLPSSVLTLGGSLINSDTVTPQTGTVLFNSTDTGEVVTLGSSSLYAMTFDSVTGGWTVNASATSTASTTLTAGTFTLSPAAVLSVGGAFTNSIGGASTTWTGSTLSLESGTYSVNTKTDLGDNYETLRIGSGADIAMWNSDAVSTAVITGGSLYSQDHSGGDGVLNIYGDYTKTSGGEYWSYATDFDGTDLSGGSERQAQVQFAAGATATLSDTLLEVLGDAAATTTISNQGSGTYTVSVSAGTTTAQYYDFADLGATGLSLLSGNVMTSLADGSFTVAAAAGTAITLSSTTIDAAPAAQIYNVTFATTTAIAATNVTQSDGAAASYWWFRDGSGNLDGESFDNDTGDPGTVRWDDSSLVLTISGTVYTDRGATAQVGGFCDDATNVITVVVEDGATYNGSCASADGSYSIGGVVVVGDPTLTIYVDDVASTYGSIITKTPTADIADADIYLNRVIVRHEDVSAMTIADMAVFDSSDDSDLRFTAATSTLADTLTAFSQTELLVWASSTFTPGGAVTLQADSNANVYDGSLYLAGDATFIGSGTTTYTVGGTFTQSAGASFIPASTTVVFNATTTGKAVTAAAGETINFNEVQFTGASGGWNINGDLSLTDDLQVAAGTVTGTGDITLLNGSFYGNGLVSLGGGTTTIAQSNTLGGTQGWTFYDLTLGTGAIVGTTTPGSSATTTIGRLLTISTAHFLDAGASVWEFAGSGDVFVEDGTFVEDTSTAVYSSSNDLNILSTDYYNLIAAADGGAPTYTATGLGVQVFGDLTVAGSVPTTVSFDTNDPALNVDGDLTIGANGIFIPSSSNSFTLAGSYDNDGTFNANTSTLTFDGSGTHTIAAGNSAFASVVLSGTGSFTVTEHATTATAFTISPNVTDFTLSSGQQLEVAGVFANQIGGAATTWTGSTLYLSGGGDYLINPATTTDTYATLRVGDATQIRSWNSDASTVTIDGTGSLYSMDHGDVTGELYVYGTYVQEGETDHWSYATDFDGTDLTGSERQVDVYVAGGGSVTYKNSGGLSVIGAATASTTIQNQGSGVYAFTIGNSGSTTMNYYDFADVDSDGVTFTGSPSVSDLSYGSFLVANNGDSAMTVGGTAITANPALTFTSNTFATSTGVSPATNVTATGTSVSSWRFTNHAGEIDGENFDSDPDGDPGYLVWDDSAASITISGTIYQNDGVSTADATMCNALWQTVQIRVAGLTTYQTACNPADGSYSVGGISYSPGDSIVVYLNSLFAQSGATVTVDPVSNIANMDVYEDRVIVRHEGTDPISIADMAVWDSSDDADIPFTAVTGSPDTLDTDDDIKILVWAGKTFEPGGDVTLSNAGTQTYRGDLDLQAGATYTANAGEELIVGGSLLAASGASFEASTASTTFTSAAAETISVNESDFYNLRFTGSGSWSISDATLSVNDIVITSGTLTLPTGTTTVSGSFNNSGGTFTNNGSTMVFDGTASGNVIAGDGSDFAELQFTGSGDWSMTDTHATATDSVTLYSGALTLTSGTLATGGSFRNEGGTITHNTSEIIYTSAGTETLLAGGSDLGGVRFEGGGTYVMEDNSLTLTESLSVDAGALEMASGTLSIGGSFDASGGSFDHASGTILFNSSDTGETVNPGGSNFYNVVFGSGTGGWTVTANATTTNNFTLSAASSFVQQSGTTLYVANVFDNSVGGSATTWSGSTLVLNGGTTYAINTKTDAGDQYDNLVITAGTDISMWSSAATSTTVAASASLYSQDNAGVDGELYIYGDYHIGTTTEYWSYARDFDGTDLSGGSERAVTVALAANATTTVDGGALYITGASGNETTITNQGSGTYDFIVNDGIYSAQYYAYRNLSADGLQLVETPVIPTLSYGDFELAVDGGSLISLSSTTLNANASLIITGNRFATTTAITGTNVNLTGVTSNAWTFVGEIGNLAGETYDIDGATLCGSIRWDDSSCLLTQQTHYRWRNDDGNAGVPNSEWYDTDWNKRKRVRLDSENATSTTNAAIKLSVTYDADMQPDFEDLRFTDSSGTTSIPFWIERYTASTDADVWVQVPTLVAKDFTTVFMYYDNTLATTTSSSTQVFVVADDFEDGDIVEYSAANDDKSLFTVDGTYAYGGSFGLDNTGSESSRANDGGIYNTNVTVSQGEIIRYMQYVSTSGGSDEVCTLFAVQSPGNNYAVCLEQVPGTDRISIAENVTDVDTSGTILSSTTVSYSTGWYEVEVDWQDSGDIDVTLSQNGSTVATVTANDPSYTSGGIGFTYWFNSGGWDNYTSRPRVETEPTAYFGAEQSNGGATWRAALDTPAGDYNVGDVARLRFVIENSGLQVTGQTYQLEYAEQGVAPSCEAVSGGSYAAVPVQSSCGSSPVCMQSSSLVTDGEAAVDLLEETNGAFIPGEVTENPANTADALTIEQNEYTELEYVLTPTVNVADENLCLRVTNAGSELDTYLRVAKMAVRFDPTLDTVNFNGGLPISLLPGTTTRVYASSTVTDLNGYADIVRATSTMFTTLAGAACTADNNNCYITTEASQCSFTACAGNSCVLECYADYYYHADPTDTDGGNSWVAFLEVEDTQGGYDFASSPDIQLSTLRALSVTNLIDYGALAPSSNTGGVNASTTIENQGNDAIDVQIVGDDLEDGYSSTIPANQQVFATSTFDYTTCTTCTALATTSINYEVDLSKPTTASPPTVDDIYWGIEIPFGAASNPHTGNNIFYAIGDDSW